MQGVSAIKGNSTRKRRRRKSRIDRPPKPYEGLPLSAANIGKWQKKINGHVYYFGRWGRVINGRMTRLQEDGCWQTALEEFEKKRDALYAGREYQKNDDSVLTVGRLCNDFLNYQLGSTV